MCEDVQAVKIKQATFLIPGGPLRLRLSHYSKASINASLCLSRNSLNEVTGTP